MEDNSFDPRTWVDSRDGGLRAGEQARGYRAGGDEADTSDGTQPGDAFPLATAAALRLWLVSMLVLALAAGGAWAMRGVKEAATDRLASHQAAVASAESGPTPAP